MAPYKLTKNKDMGRGTMQMLKQPEVHSNITVKNKLSVKYYSSSNSQPNQPTNPTENQKVTQSTHDKKVTKVPGDQKAKRLTGLKEVDQAKISYETNIKEYHPDKGKRKVQMNKIVLQPKHDYKVVATTNKRKRRTPHKELDISQSGPSSTSLHDILEVEDLSLSELVALAEDRGLDDEDFMEILTCPSPVWWEEHSDDEGEKCLKSHKDLDEDASEPLQDTLIHKLTTDSKDNQIIADTKQSLKNDINFTRKFISKRSKLEKILGYIKCKKTTPETTCLNKIKVINEEKDMILEESNIDNSIVRNNKKNRIDSNASLSDVSISEELINTLEKINIPVKKQKVDEENIKNDLISENSPNKSNGSDEIIIESIYQSRKRIRKPNKKYEFNLKAEKKNRVRTKNKLTTNEINVNIVPPVLPPLTKKPENKIKVYRSPKFIESPNSGAVDVDSISVTNVKFIDEDEDAKQESAEPNQKIKKKGNGEGEELVTVYQIVTNKVDNFDVESQIKVNLVNKSPQTNTDNIINSKRNGQINSFYKTRKKIHKRKRKCNNV